MLQTPKTNQTDPEINSDQEHTPSITTRGECSTFPLSNTYATNGKDPNNLNMGTNQSTTNTKKTTDINLNTNQELWLKAKQTDPIS